MPRLDWKPDRDQIIAGIGTFANLPPDTLRSYGALKSNASDISHASLF